jgi:probable HAF family extracellular repeat protein
LVLTGLLLASAGQSLYGLNFRLLDIAPGTYASQPIGISADGSVIAGIAVGDWVLGPADQPLLWTASGGAQGLGPYKDSQFSWGAGISGDGTTLIGSAYGSGIRSFRYLNGNFEELLLPPNGVGADAYGVNYDGTVITGTLTTDLPGPEYRWSAFRWTPGGMEDLGLLPQGTYSFGFAVSADGNVITGFGDTPKGERAFRWTPGGGLEALPALSKFDWAGAYSISADGSTVLGYSGSQAARWVGNHVQGLRQLSSDPFAFSVAYTSSGNGSLIGGMATDDAGDTRAMLWNQHVGMVDLNEWLAGNGVDLAGWELEYVTAISADGSTLAGIGRLNGEFQGWILSDFGAPAPEAAPGWAALGLAGWAVTRSVRRRQQQPA